MSFLDKIAYFLITRGKAVISYLKKFTQPRYVIAFVLIYPYIYTHLETVIRETQVVFVNLAGQFRNWIEAVFWGVYYFLREKLGSIWFGEQIAYALAGIAVAPLHLLHIILERVFIPVANIILTISLNVLGVAFYLFCKVVIPALKMAYGAYLFARFMPASYKYIAKALDRFAQGRFSGFIGAVMGSLAPFSGFFLGPLIISIVTDPVCRYAYAPLTVQPPYPVPYVSPVVYHFTLDPTMSWIISILYGQYFLPPNITMSYIDTNISWHIYSLISLSYIFPYLYYSYTSGYTSGYLPPTVSYIFAEVPISSISIRDTSFVAGPPYVHAYVQDFSYIMGPPYVYAYIYDFSYLTLPPQIFGYIHDFSYVAAPPTFNVEILDLSYLVPRQ